MITFSLYSGSLGECVWSRLVYSPCQRKLFIHLRISLKNRQEVRDVTDVMEQTHTESCRIMLVSTLDKFSTF